MSSDEVLQRCSSCGAGLTLDHLRGTECPYCKVVFPHLAQAVQHAALVNQIMANQMGQQAALPQQAIAQVSGGGGVPGAVWGAQAPGPPGGAPPAWGAQPPGAPGAAPPAYGVTPPMYGAPPGYGVTPPHIGLTPAELNKKVSVLLVIALVGGGVGVLIAAVALVLIVFFA